jgi:hypothetical protein
MHNLLVALAFAAMVSCPAFVASLPYEFDDEA